MAGSAIAPMMLTVDQAAQAIGCSRSTVYQLLKGGSGKGQIRYVRLLGARRRIPISEIERFINDNLVGKAK